MLQPNTPTDVVIQSWRGQDSLAEAAKRGYKGLLSSGYYIDLNQPAAEHYLVDPMGKAAAELPNDAKQRILGGEATMWSEFVTPENVDSRIWPRTAAIAERYWSPESVTDVASMYERMAAVSLKLEYYGLQHRASYKMMLARMTGQADPATLRVLGDVVQPPRGYERGSLRSYDSFSPLNRLVDAVPPESDTARHFHDLVRLIVSGKAAPGEVEEARSLLVLWRDNDARLQPLLANSELTSELAPLSTSLRQVAEVGLAAVDHLQKGDKAPAGWRDQQLQFLKQAAAPQAVLLNMTVPAVTELVQAVPAN